MITSMQGQSFLTYFSRTLFIDGTENFHNSIHGLATIDYLKHSNVGLQYMHSYTVPTQMLNKLKPSAS